MADGRKCSGCGNGPLPLNMPGIYHEVTGFEEVRAGGGANKIVLRERTGKILCASCVAKRKSGIAPAQEGMKL